VRVPQPVDLARGWRRAEGLLDEEADRLATMSDDAFEREMASLSEAGRVPGADELRRRALERQRDGASSSGWAPVETDEPCDVDAPRSVPRRLARRRPQLGGSWVVWLVAILIAVALALAWRAFSSRVRGGVPWRGPGAP